MVGAESSWVQKTALLSSSPIPGSSILSAPLTQFPQSLMDGLNTVVPLRFEHSLDC